MLDVSCKPKSKFMNNEVLKNVLSKSKKNKSLISLHKASIDDFCVGYVIDFNDSHIVIQHITKYGVKDGIHVDEIANLEKIETESTYLKACQVLFENPTALPEQTINNPFFSLSESWQYDLLNGNSSTGELIAFELSGDTMFNFGFLIDFDENNFIVHLVGESGESQGTNVYHLIDVSAFGFDTLQCRKRRHMFNLLNKASS